MDTRQLAEDTRTEFKALSVERRIDLIKNTATRLPKEASKVLLSGLPPAFQLGRIGHWLTASLSHRVESVMLDAKYEGLLAQVVVSFFTEARPAMNNRLLALMPPEGKATLDKALAVLKKEFAADPFFKLYAVAVRWVRTGDEEAQEEDAKAKATAD